MILCGKNAFWARVSHTISVDAAVPHLATTLKLSFGFDQDAAASIKHIPYHVTCAEHLQVCSLVQVCHVHADFSSSALVETRRPTAETETGQFPPDQSQLCAPQMESNRWHMFPSFLLPLRNLSNEISIWWIIVVRQKQMFIWWCSFEARAFRLSL